MVNWIGVGKKSGHESQGRCSEYRDMVPRSRGSQLEEGILTLPVKQVMSGVKQSNFLRRSYE